MCGLSRMWPLSGGGSGLGRQMTEKGSENWFIGSSDDFFWAAAKGDISIELHLLFFRTRNFCFQTKQCQPHDRRTALCLFNSLVTKYDLSYRPGRWRRCSIYSCHPKQFRTKSKFQNCARAGNQFSHSMASAFSIIQINIIISIEYSQGCVWYGTMTPGWRKRMQE